MSDLPWSRVEEIYHAALERSPELRATFLAEICANDFELRREVESLLAHSGDVLDTPAWAHITSDQEPWSQTPLLQAGMTLGPYEIMRRIGAGGMGEVYLGRDKRLNRAVALKVLPAYLRLDFARKKRFEREVKSISTLNHPHICTVSDQCPGSSEVSFLTSKTALLYTHLARLATLVRTAGQRDQED